MLSIRPRKFPSTHSLQKVYVMNPCRVLSRGFPASVDGIARYVFSLRLFFWRSAWIDLGILNEAYIPQVNSTNTSERMENLKNGMKVTVAFICRQSCLMPLIALRKA